MKIQTALRITAVIAMTAGAVAAQDFRGLKWGASQADVSGVEHGKPFIWNATHMAFAVQLSGLNVNASYYFQDGKTLSGGAYWDLEKHSDAEGFVSDFDTLRKDLADKYGKPHQDVVEWTNDLFKGSYPAKFGLAVSMGHATRTVLWQTPATYIVLSLSGDNSETDVIIQYVSPQEWNRDHAADAKKRSDL